MFSTVNDSDWEGQIEIKYESLPECMDIKEIKEESADCQQFRIKIEEGSVDENLEDLPRGSINDDRDINRGDHENFDSSEHRYLNSSIGILDAKNSLKCQYTGYNCDDVINMNHHVIVAHNGENECSIHQNISSSNLVSPTSNSRGIASKINVNRKRKSVEIYKCEHCDFESLQMSSCHTSIAIKEEICKCDSDYESPQMFASNFHTNSKDTREKIHKCQYCDYESTRMSNLRRHINSNHTREKLHKCQYCDYEAADKTKLKCHINSKHTREKLHKCQYCDYECTRMSYLKIHINSKHTREKLYKCQYCDYETSYKSKLKNHINAIHTREEIYKCEYCDYENTLISTLKRHINSKHLGKLHKCQYCDYESAEKSNLKRHVNSIHTRVKML